MVADEVQHAAVDGCAGDQADPDRDLGGQVEGFGGEVGEEVRHGAGGVHGGDVDGRLRRGQQHRFGAVRARSDEGAQHFVAFDQVAHCGAEHVEVEWVGDVDGQRHVVGAAGLVDLFDEPEPPLGVGEHGRFPRCAPGHDGPVVGRGGEAARERGRGGRLEQVADADVGAEQGAQPGHGSGGEQGVAA